MKPPYRFEVSLNGFILGSTYQKYQLTGLKYSIRLARRYQQLCQNVPIDILIYKRPIQKVRPWNAGDFEFIERKILKKDRKKVAV